MPTPCLRKFKLPPLEGGAKLSPENCPRPVTLVATFIWENELRKNISSAKEPDTRHELFFYRLFSSFTRFGKEGERGTGFPKKGKRLGMQVACVSRACIRPRECDKLYEEAGAKGSP